MIKKRKVALLTLIFILFSLALFGCGNNDNDEDNNDALQVSWWGDKVKHENRTESVEKFQEDNDVKADVTYSGWEGYWDKLSTRVSAGNTPDVFFMSSRYLKNYVDNGTIMELNENDLNLDDFEEEGVELGKVDDKLYGIPTGTNAHILSYNSDLLEETDVDFDPDERLTWDEMSDTASEMSDQLPDEVYPIENSIGDWEVFEYFARDNGDNFYSEDSEELEISKKTMINWFNFWLELQNKDLTPSAEESASYSAGEYEQQPLVKGEAVFSIKYNNVVMTVNDLMEDEVKMALAPKLDNGHEPYFLHASAYWVVSDDTAHEEDSVDLLDHLLTDTDLAEKTGTSEGVPVHKESLETLKEDEDDDEEQEQIEIMDKIKEELGDTPNIDVPDAGRLEDEFSEISESVLFEELTPEEATDEFFERAESING